ncbi:Uncharacterised protein [uncultured archaeon]|nr:Uncharacterised protein [uncultured archaeon]
MNKRWNRKGQITIFIIIGIIIVVAGFLIYSFYPQIKTTFGAQAKTPQSYIQTCIEKGITDAVTKISLQGGSLNPENFILKDNNKVEFLCYTNQYFKATNKVFCVVQQPMLKQHIESEIKNAISSEVNSCFSSMKSSYESQGYSVDLKSGATSVELLPKRIVSTFNYSLTLTKGDTQKYDSFVVILNNNLYELVAIANSILQWEVAYGDAEVTTYMAYYHDLKVEKDLRDSGEKIYSITDRNTGNKFEFASKSQIWAAGYATS